MAGEVVHGLAMRVPKASREYPELVAAAREALLANLAAKVAAEGWQMVGEPAIVREIPVSWIRVAHHEHGWQLDEVQVAPEDAEQWLVVAEVTCAAR